MARRHPVEETGVPGARDRAQGRVLVLEIAVDPGGVADRCLAKVSNG